MCGDLLSNVLYSFRKNKKVPMVLAIWIPILSLSLFCGIGVLQINEK